ncbi:hypothetical protein HA052_04650 [Chromobacterium haemolyticum]|uniref:Uncharacterized protein n=1 Tax=Chromobacterium fluminis TaxID=3044269 RepID=A0ABX0KYB0_9NEIS|nr:hypothetical protein [Chromobacterium haemolyticum]NHR04480.1 hypothetical protein [Chromobacterium haemolyticum]
MQSARKPNLQPLSMLPMIAGVVDDQLASLQQQLDNLERAHARPGSMDDVTIDRVLLAFGETRDLLPVFARQLNHWRDSSPSAAQRDELDRLDRQLTKSRKALDAILALAPEIKTQTIESLIARSDAILGLEGVQGSGRFDG